MSKDNPGVLHDATNSWNGYNHQGKIALYYAVKRIKELLEDAADRAAGIAALRTWFLEVEYTEDFSVGTIGADGAQRYQTIHQVKDRKDTALGKYESAIQGLAVNMVRHPEIEEAYLHVTSAISEAKGKTFAESVSGMLQKTKWIDEQEQSAQDKEDPAERQEALDWVKKVRDGLPAIWQDPDMLKKIQKYPYETDGEEEKYYCPKNEARDYVHGSLRDFYRAHDPGAEYKQGDDFIKKSYQYLLEKLNEHVVHRAVHYGEKDAVRYILLSELYDWLVSPEIERMGDEYYLYYIRAGYFEYLDEFCSACKQGKCEGCQVCAFKGRFRGMNPAELRAFVCQTNPNVPSRIAIEQYHKFLQRSGIRDPFWKELRRIAQKPEALESSNTVKYRGADNQTYILTTLAASISAEDEEDEELAQEEVKTICTEIYRNQTERGLRLDGRCLLSKKIDVESVQECALTINPSDMFRDPNHIAASDRLSIVSVEAFKSNHMRKEHEEA